MRTITVTLPDDVADEVERMAADVESEGIADPERETMYEMARNHWKPVTREELVASLHKASGQCARGECRDAMEVMDEMIASFDDVPEPTR
jgi:hypothetical protein